MRFLYRRRELNREVNVVLLIFLLAVIVYANSLVNSFVWDDRYLIVENNLIKNWRNIPQFFTTQLYQGSGQESHFYRPIQKLSIFLDYSIWKLKPLGYHITNILIHALNAVLVYVLLNLLFRKKEISLISALLFAVHPIHTEVVTYISTRADLLTGLFIFSSLILFIQYRKHSNLRGYYWGAILCFIFALLSKEPAVILPFILILCDISFNRNYVPIISKGTPCFKLRVWLSDYLPFLLLLCVYIVLRLTVLDFGLWLNETNLYLRMITLGKVFFTYIRLLFLPFGLHMEYTLNWAVSFFQPQILISNFLFFSILLVVIRSYKYSKIFFFASAWFLLTLVPSFNIVTINAFMSENWLYIPSVGFFVLFSLGVFKLADCMKTQHIRKSFLIFSIVPILAIYSILTIIRNRDWRDEMTLYKNTLKYSPNSARVHNNLGIVYAHIENYEMAIKEFEEAIRLKHGYFEAYNNLGTIYQRQKLYEQAIKQYEKIIELNPNYSGAYNNLGGTYILLGRYKEAIKECERALVLREDYVEAHANLGTAYTCMGKLEQAVTHYKKVIELNPDYLEAYTNLGVVYNTQGKYLEAIETLKEAVRLKPKRAETHNDLGTAYKNLGEYEKAIHEYRIAIELNPEYAQAYNDAGVIYSILGNYEEATKHYKKAIEIDGNFFLPYANLGITYLDTKNYRLAEEYLKQAEKSGLPVQKYLDELKILSTDTEVIPESSKTK